MMNIEDFGSNLLKQTRNHTKILIYNHIGYVTIKNISDYEYIHKSFVFYYYWNRWIHWKKMEINT